MKTEEENNLLNFTPIRIEWNLINGFIFEIFHIESCKPNLDDSLFGLSFSKDFFYIHLFYFAIRVYERKYPTQFY